MVSVCVCLPGFVLMLSVVYTDFAPGIETDQAGEGKHQQQMPCTPHHIAIEGRSCKYIVKEEGESMKSSCHAPFSCWRETEEGPEITSISWLP